MPVCSCSSSDEDPNLEGGASGAKYLYIGRASCSGRVLGIASPVNSASGPLKHSYKYSPSSMALGDVDKSRSSSCRSLSLWRAGVMHGVFCVGVLRQDVEAIEGNINDDFYVWSI